MRFLTGRGQFFFPFPYDGRRFSFLLRYFPQVPLSRSTYFLSIVQQIAPIEFQMRLTPTFIRAAFSFDASLHPPFPFPRSAASEFWPGTALPSFDGLSKRPPFYSFPSLPFVPPDSPQGGRFQLTSPLRRDHFQHLSRDKPYFFSPWHCGVFFFKRCADLFEPSFVPLRKVTVDT